MVKIGKKRRNMYKVWLKDLIMLKAFTGRRNDELFEMRWDMIHYEDDQPIYIMSPDIKINKLQNNFDRRDFQFSYVPIGVELKSLLNQLGMKNKRGSSEYIIAPSIETRKTPVHLNRIYLVLNPRVLITVQLYFKAESESKYKVVE